MTWEIPVLLRLLVAYIATPLVSKRIVGLPSRTRRLRAMFLINTLFSLTFCAVAGVNPFDPGTPYFRYFLYMLGIGIVASFGIYCMWRAIDISLSKQSLMTWMDDAIPVVMGYALLGEAEVLNLPLSAGVALSVTSVLVYCYLDIRAKSATEKPTAGSFASVLKFVLGYSVIIGVAHFFFRVFALKDLPPAAFLTGWYGGAFLGSNVVLMLMGSKEAGEPLTRKGVLGVSCLCVCIWSSLWLEYLANIKAHLTVTQPIFGVAETILPTVIGLYMFGERKELTAKTKVIFLLAFIGSIIIALSYRAG